MRPRIFKIQKDISFISQGNDSIATYFTRIKKLWDELASLKCIPACSCATGEVMVQYQQDQRLLEFLMGLHESFIHARGTILMNTPLPKLAYAYSMLS